MTKDELSLAFEQAFKEIMNVRQAGQQEYAHDSDNAFANFERLARQLEMPREKVLWVYLMKHMDGILAYLNGHTSQREPVTGRIKDAVTYLLILRGMVIENESRRSKKVIVEYNSAYDSETGFQQ